MITPLERLALDMAELRALVTQLSDEVVKMRKELTDAREIFLNRLDDGK